MLVQYTVVQDFNFLSGLKNKNLPQEKVNTQKLLSQIFDVNGIMVPVEEL